MSNSTHQYVIERDLPGAGKLTPAELRDISARSCAILDRLGSTIRWMHSYVTDDKVYCIYSTADPVLIRRHADLGGFPANRVSPIRSIIDPTTAGQ